MRNILKCFIICSIIILWGIACKGTIQAHTSQHTVPHDDPMTFDTVVELKTPEAKIPEIPDIRLVSFEDEFAVKPIIRNLTEEDKRILMQIACAEARSEGIDGMVLVMNVVINRCEKTGQSVKSVVYAPNQFYVNGMPNVIPDDCYEALELLMIGQDESQGAIYFTSRGYSQYGTPLFQYKHHYFSA